MSKNRLIFLIDRVEGGGAENVILKLVKYFSKKNDTFLITNYVIKREFLYKIEFTNYLNTNIKNEKSLFDKILSMIKYFIFVKKHIKTHNPKFVLSFLERSNIINILVSIFTKHKTVISIRNNLTIQYKDRNFIEKTIATFLIRKTYNHADLIVSLSYAVKNDLVTNFGINEKKIVTLYNPYNIKYLSQLSHETLSDDFQNLYKYKQVCITAGRLSEQKGYKYLIRTFKLVVEKNKNALLLILGEGELEEQLKTLINSLNLNENIKIIGYHKNPYKFISKADLFIFSSLWEGFGNALLEALACKTMVISTDCDFGPKEILNKKILNKEINNIYYGDYGVLVPKIDINHSNISEQLMANAILESLNDKELRDNYVKKGFERANEFEENIIFNKWEKTLKEKLD